MMGNHRDKREFIARANAALIEQIKSRQWSLDYSPSLFDFRETATLTSGSVELRAEVKGASGHIDYVRYRIGGEYYSYSSEKLDREARKLFRKSLDRYWTAKREEDYQKLVAMALKAEDTP